MICGQQEDWDLESLWKISMILVKVPIFILIQDLWPWFMFLTILPLILFSPTLFLPNYDLLSPPPANLIDLVGLKTLRRFSYHILEENLFLSVGSLDSTPLGNSRVYPYLYFTAWPVCWQYTRVIPGFVQEGNTDDPDAPWAHTRLCVSVWLQREPQSPIFE